MQANFEWYEALNGYFPDYEMKSLNQMLLLNWAYPMQYHIEATEEYVLVTYETAWYVFVDYLLVRQTSKRGTGIGSRLLDAVKARKKLIVLEIEPPDSDRPETIQRHRFYVKNGFEHIRSVGHRTERLFVREPNALHVMTWCPSFDKSESNSQCATQQAVFAAMRDVYCSVHTYATEACYGWLPQPVHEVVTWKEEINGRDDSYDHSTLDGVNLTVGPNKHDIRAK